MKELRIGVIAWLSLLGLMLVALLFVPNSSHVLAQNSGQFGASTVAKAFSSTNSAIVLQVQNPTNPSQPTLLPNIGASAHYLSFCGTNVTNLQLVLEGSFDATNWVPLGPASPFVQAPSATICTVLTAGGYAQNVRARVSSIGGGGTVQAWYSATAGPITSFPPAVQDTGGSANGGGVSPSTCSHGNAVTVANNTTSQLLLNGNVVTGYVCDVVISFGGAVTASGTVNLFTATNAGCNAGVVQVGEIFAGTGAAVDMGSNLGALYQVPITGFFCATTTGVGTNTMVSYTFANY